MAVKERDDNRPCTGAALQSEPFASILLVTKNGERYLEECLAGIFSQKVDFPFEVIAVDSGSTDRTLSILSRYSVRIHQIKPSDFGHGRTRNFAAGLARGKFIVFLTQDATPANGQWLGELVRNIENTPGAAGAYSRWLCRREGHVLEKIWIEQLFVSTPRIQKIEGSCQDLDKKQNRRLILFSNVSSCICRAVWEKIRFDEGTRFAEDQMWAKQAIEAGYSIVYAPSSEVYHSHNDPWSVFIKRNIESGMAFGRISTLRKVPLPFSWPNVFRSIIREGREQGKGPFAVFLFLLEASCRCITGEICNRVGYCRGVFLNRLEKIFGKKD